MTLLQKRYVPEILIAVTAIFLFLPFIGAIHLFDWDEINFAESAREMIVTGDFLTVGIDFKPFWEKPPLFIWMQVLSMKLFGINEFAARFPNVICGVVTLLVLFRTGRRIFDSWFGILWVLAYTGSILPFFYFKSGIIDPWFNLFIFAGLIQFIFLLEEEKRSIRWQNVILSATFIGLAILTKGPVAFLVFGLTVGVFWILNRFNLKISTPELLVYLIVLLFIGGLWFILQILIGNFDVLVDFVVYQIRLFKTKDAGHGGFFLYHFVILLFGVFPASLFALQGFRRSYFDGSFQKKFKRWSIILFWVVLIIFTIVRTKIVHYSSLCYFPLTFLGAYIVYKITNKQLDKYRWINILVIIIGILYGMLVMAMPLVGNNIQWIVNKGWIADQFALGNLEAEVHWPGYVSLIGMFIILGIFLSFYLSGKNKKQGYVCLFLTTTIFIYLSMIFITPRIEKYSQNALIEFCKERQGENCYVKTLGMKSYAQLFYTMKDIPDQEGYYDNEWLLSGNAPKPVYFIMRNRSQDKYFGMYPDLVKLYEKNGYVFSVIHPSAKDVQKKTPDD